MSERHLQTCAPSDFLLLSFKRSELSPPSCSLISLESLPPNPSAGVFWQLILSQSYRPKAPSLAHRRVWCGEHGVVGCCFCSLIRDGSPLGLYDESSRGAKPRLDCLSNGIRYTGRHVVTTSNDVSGRSPSRTGLERLGSKGFYTGLLKVNSYSTVIDCLGTTRGEGRC